MQSIDQSSLILSTDGLIERFRENVSQFCHLNLEENECLEVWSLAKLLDRVVRFRLHNEGLTVLKLVAERKCLCGNHDPLKPPAAVQQSLLNDVFEQKPIIQLLAEFIVMAGKYKNEFVLEFDM